MSDSTKPEENPPDGELRDEELDQISGGRLRLPDVVKAPTPGGPVPIPYPNVGAATKS